MITSAELENTIATIEASPEALAAFTRRVARLLAEELEKRCVTFHAINGVEFSVGNPWGFNKIASLRIFSTFGDGWKFEVSEGLAHDSHTGSEAALPSVTSLSNAELSKMVEAWAEQISKAGPEIAFCNFYVPKAVIHADGFNDLKVAFRFVRAWDAVMSCEILRLDAAFKNIS